MEFLGRQTRRSQSCAGKRERLFNMADISPDVLPLLMAISHFCVEEIFSGDNEIIFSGARKRKASAEEEMMPDGRNEQEAMRIEGDCRK